MAGKDLLKHCYTTLTTFKPGDEDSEIFLQNYLVRNKITDPTLSRNITAIFFGCVKFDKVIRIVVDAFYAKEGSTVLLSERHVYTVFTYLVLFYIDAIGLPAFRKLISAHHIVRMYKFLSLLCDAANLRSWMKDAWKRIYDESYVDSHLLGHVLRWLPELLMVVSDLEDKISNSDQRTDLDGDDSGKITDTKPKNITVQQPFELTKPKPRAVPVPELIPRIAKMKEVPDTTYAHPKEREVIDEKRWENMQKAQALLEEANTHEFACATASRTKPEHVTRRMEAIKLEEEAKILYRPPRLNPTPKSTLRSEATIKLNTAAILREKKLCEDIEREQLKKIEDLENGAFSDVEYRKWKNEMEQRQAEATRAEAEDRLIKARLAREIAELAHAESAIERKKLADGIKEDSKRRMKLYLDEKMVEKAEMRKMVDQIISDRGKVGEAKAKLKEIKQKLVQEVTQESREMLAQAIEEAEVEMRHRAELIANIRALEAVPLIRQKLFDKTETAGYGFLQEMSIAELEERIELLKADREKERMERQDLIVQEKQQRQQKLTEAMDRIARHRMARSRVAAAVKLKEAAHTDDSFLNSSSATSSRMLLKQSNSQTELNKITAEKRAAVQERRRQIAEQMASPAGNSRHATSTGTARRHQKFRKLLEEEHFKVHEKAQKKRDLAIGTGQRKDFDSLKLLYS